MIGAISSSHLGKLNFNSRNSANSMQASANKLLRVGNPAELNRVQGDSGAFLSKTRIGAESRNKSNLMKSLQNAVSYVQMQEAGIKKLEQTYQRMSQLAMLASDPFLEDSTRAQLNEEFQALKQDSFSLRSDTFMGNYLYDDMAAKYFPEIDFGKGFTDKTTGDSEVEVGTLTAPPSGWTGTKILSVREGSTFQFREICFGC